MPNYKFIFIVRVSVHTLEQFSPDFMGERNQTSIQDRNDLQAELKYGVQKAKPKKKIYLFFKNFFCRFVFLPFYDASTLIYGKIRADFEQKVLPICRIDMLVAALAIAHDCIFGNSQLEIIFGIANLKCETWVK